MKDINRKKIYHYTNSNGMVPNGPGFSYSESGTEWVKAEEYSKLFEHATRLWSELNQVLGWSPKDDFTYSAFEALDEFHKEFLKEEN